jgi:hypothetical protein
VCRVCTQTKQFCYPREDMCCRHTLRVVTQAKTHTISPNVAVSLPTGRLKLGSRDVSPLPTRLTQGRVTLDVLSCVFALADHYSATSSAARRPDMEAGETAHLLAHATAAASSPFAHVWHGQASNVRPLGSITPDGAPETCAWPPSHHLPPSFPPSLPPPPHPPSLPPSRHRQTFAR